MEEELYRVNTTYAEWMHVSKSLWTFEGDIVCCNIDMPDECVGEVARLARYVDKKLFSSEKSLYKE